MVIRLKKRDYLPICLLAVTFISASASTIVTDVRHQGTESCYWMLDSPILEDDINEESWPSMAADSNGNLYVAYQHYDSSFEGYRIYISKSTDAGQTWAIFHTIQKITSLLHPSMSIDPYDNRIYVAYEEEVSTRNHDILCSVYTGTEWMERKVDDDAQNDCFPSVTSDYQFGSSNYQYISYENVVNHNDRDLNVAKSADHGNSWEKNWHYMTIAADVITHTDITTSQDGHIYVAYAIGHDYDSQKYIYVVYGDRSYTGGSNINNRWFENIATVYSPNDLYGGSWPSIAASHSDPDYLVIVFQRYVTSTNDDVCYAYTDDGGSSWYWGNISNTSFNERHPIVVVDGQGSSSTSISGYFRVAYYHGLFTYYKQAYHNTPGNWNPYPSRPNPISCSSGTGANDQVKSISMTTQKDGGSWWPNVVWTDSRGSSYDLYSTTPRNNPILPEFPSADTTPPSISVLSPENKTYLEDDVSLAFTVSESTSWTSYSLDGQMNVTINGNTTLSGLPDGMHSLIVYAEDAAGNTGASEIVYFSVEVPELELFPVWIAAVIVILFIFGAILLVYFKEIKKTTEKVK